MADILVKAQTVRIVHRICYSIVAILLLGTKADCQTATFHTNFTYFKTNIVNDTNNLNAAYKAYRQGAISKAEIMLVTLATLNDEPIVFYGKLEDQFSNAVANATINFDVRVNNGVESTVHRGQVVSDAKGFFNISGYHGESLGVMPQQVGFAVATRSTFFKYSRMEENYHVPEPHNPVVVKVWKIQGDEPLVGISKQYKIHYTNAPICFDLIAGTIVTNGGDLRITVSRPPGIISGRNPQWWKVNFEVIDGGLIDSSGTERTTYFAPESGYQQSKTISSSDRLREGGTGGFHTGFYLKSRNGQVYAKLGVSFGINENPDDLMYFMFAGAANTNHSRNLEAELGTYLHPGF
jgi:hypothetical protein